MRQTVLVLLAAVGLVLLIVCANVANLLLSRALARQRELAIRSALGATRGRIARQLIGEAVLLAACGAAFGTLLAWIGVEWLQALRPANLPRLRDIGIDARVLLFTAGVAVAAGLVAGLAPAIGLRRLDLQRTLAAAGRGSAGPGSMWGRGGSLRRVLVASQLGLAVVLVIAAGLLVRTVINLQRVTPGFSAENVLTFELTFTGQKYANGPLVLDAYRNLWERLSSIPGVRHAGGVTSLPLSGHFAWGPVTVEGRIPPPGENFINADQRIVGHRYFEAMGIPLKQGRFFDARDVADAESVVIIDEFMAREFWPTADPIGKRIRLGDLKSTAPWQTVVGVVGRVKQYGLEADGRIALYAPQTQRPARAMYVAVKSSTDMVATMTAVRDQVSALDPNLPIYRMRPMTTVVNASLARQQFAMQLLALFALVALVLAAIGTYGVMAYVVAQGTRELGIRLALGASGRGILALVLRQGLIVAGAGIVIGLGVAVAVTRILRTLIFGVDAVDPMTFATVGGLLTITAVLATLLPALRASRIDPVISLRQE